MIPPRPDRRRPRDGVVTTVVLILVGGALVAGVVLVTVDPGDIVVGSARPSAFVPSPSPAATDDVPTGPGGDYSILGTAVVDGERVPIRWNPCEPIQYQLHLEANPRGIEGAVHRALAAATEGSGIDFRFDGKTHRTVRDLLEDDYFADPDMLVYRPVLIDVVSHRTFHSFHEGRAVAFAHPEEGIGALDDQYVGGMVVLDGGIGYPHSGRWSMQLVLQHELGHLLGLGHVRATDELMFSYQVAEGVIPAPIFGWGPGDLEGLGVVGARQGCLVHVRVAA